MKLDEHHIRALKAAQKLEKNGTAYQSPDDSDLGLLEKRRDGYFLTLTGRTVLQSYISSSELA